MKNKFQSVLILGLVLCLGACKDDFLEILPADQPPLEAFYNNENEIRAATATLYGRPWFDYNDKFGWAAGDGLPGDLYNDYLDEGQLFFFSFSSNNRVVADGWRGLFNVIAYSNAIINDMPPIASGKGVSQAAIDRGLGEARFMRAVAYFHLVEFWGEVPIVENAASIVSSGNLNIPKNTVSSVREFIRRDLAFAAEHLPASDQPGRVTQWAAKGMLAKLHLTIAQATKSADEFTKAKAYAQDVVENSGRSLLPNYANLFKVEFNNNPESLFALQWTNGEWGIGNSRQAVFGRNSQITNNGEAWGGWKSATYSFMKNLEENAGASKDLRQPAIYMTQGDHYPEIRKTKGGYTYNIIVRDAKNEPIEHKSPLLNNIKKYVVGSQEDVGVAVNNQAVPLNLNMLRLADVYLIYAEAAIGTANATSEAKALEYYNAVRTRAGLEPRTEISFRDIFNERRVEFGMEGINWLDVKRFSYRDQAAALQYLNDQKRANTYQRVMEGGQAVGDENSWEGYVIQEPATPITVTAGDLILPIPAAEVIDNPNLAPGAEAVDYEFE